MTRSRRIVAPAAWLGLVAAGLAWVAPAPILAQRSLSIEAFDATVRVEKSGWIDVREQIQVHFSGSWNGIFRTIPVEYRTPQGFSYRLLLEDVSVRDPEGAALEFTNTREGHYRKLKIRVPGADNATRKVVIHYRVPNALKFWQDYDELYWNVTGDEWEVPIRSVSVMVLLPPGVSGTRTASWTGGYGSKQEAASVEKTEDGFYFETTQPLSYREGLTIAVAWDPGVVARPSLLTKIRFFLEANWLFVLPLLSLLAMWRIWLAKGRDPERLSIVPQYEPPEGLSPSEAGTLVDNRPDLRDLTSAIVDLAVRGYLRIEEIEKTGALAKLVGKTDYRLHTVRDRTSWSELTEHEQRLLQGIFGAGGAGVGESVTLSSLEHEFYQNLPGVKDAIFSALVSRGYYERRPDKVIQKYFVIGVLVLGAALALAVPLADRLQMAPLTAILAAIGTALPILGFAFVMPARTTKGARARELVLGFEEFLKRVDSDRYRRMITSPEMFERFLPYAMAFGVAEKWSRAFEGLYKEPPSWYVGTWNQGFRPLYFAQSMGHLSSMASTAMGTGPRSSGGSGFGGGGGGGGFSGGGFGGGGGGGW